MKFKFLIIYVCVMAVVAIGIGVFTAGGEAAIAETNEQLMRVQAETDGVRAAKEQEAHDVAVEAAGLDTELISVDEKLLEQFFRDTCTWSSGDEYVKARETAMNEYGLAADSEFMTTYLAEPSTYQLQDGTTRYTIDSQGWNMDFNDVDTRLIEKSKTARTYFCSVTCDSTFKDTVDTTTSTFIVSVDDNQKIASIVGSNG